MKKLTCGHLGSSCTFYWPVKLPTLATKMKKSSPKQKKEFSTESSWSSRKFQNRPLHWLTSFWQKTLSKGFQLRRHWKTPGSRRDYKITILMVVSSLSLWIIWELLTPISRCSKSCWVWSSISFWLRKKWRIRNSCLQSSTRTKTVYSLDRSSSKVSEQSMAKSLSRR